MSLWMMGFLSMYSSHSKRCPPTLPTVLTDNFRQASVNWLSMDLPSNSMTMMLYSPKSLTSA
jgi:hypothetical protein